MGVHRRKILSAVGASMALIGGLLAATALVGVVPAGAVTLWAPTTACGVFDTTTVPAGVTSMTIKVEGARAGAAGSGTSSGTEKSDPGFGGEGDSHSGRRPGSHDQRCGGLPRRKLPQLELRRQSNTSSLLCRLVQGRRRGAR
jgi:hypothetical protein